MDLAKRTASALLVAVLFAAIVLVTGHLVEKRSREQAIKHSDRVSCLHYNDLAYAVNLFHGTIHKFLLSARLARRREIEALSAPDSPPPSPRVAKIIRADRQAVDSYTQLLKGVTLTPYEHGCPVRRLSASHVGK